MLSPCTRRGQAELMNVGSEHINYRPRARVYHVIHEILPSLKYVLAVNEKSSSIFDKFVEVRISPSSTSQHLQMNIPLSSLVFV